jgi:dethiobiotin synthetase
MTGFFVTATGTDIGKTYVTAGLIRHLRGRGETVSALKPVVSGISPETLGASDPAVLLEALGKVATDKSIAAVSRWRFAAPLSPDMAAAREGRSIEFDELVAFCQEELASTKGTMFIEGVGGVLVPLDARHTVRDWMISIDLPAIVVAGSYLGTISHTLTALEALARGGLKIAALVINESVGSTVPFDETVSTLARFAPDIPIVALPRSGPDSDAAVAELWRVLHSK